MAVAAAYIVAAYIVLGLTGWAARGAADEAVQTARSGVSAAREGDHEAAVLRLDVAADIFDRLASRFDGWWLRSGALAPGFEDNRRALHAISLEAAALSRSAERAAAQSALSTKGLIGGAVNLADLARLRSEARRITRASESALEDLARTRSAFLVPPVRSALRTAAQQVASSAREAKSLDNALGAAHSLLGGTGARRYLIVFMTPSELRASGGIVGSYAEMTATDGRLQLVRVGRDSDLNTAGNPASRQITGPPEYLRRYGRWEPATHWQNVTMTPDFPTASRVMAELYPQSGGSRVDGVLGIDPGGLAALLRLTGPVRVASWPEPISAENAERVLLYEQYLEFETPDRVAFLAEVAQATFTRLTTKEIGSIDQAMKAFGPAIRARRIQLSSAHADEQAYLRQVGAAGALPPVAGDFVAVVNQNASGSKVDHFLSRSLRYDVRFDPATSTVHSVATVTMKNRSPTSGLPRYVIGPNPNAGTSPAAGTNRTYLSLYSPLQLQSVTVDGAPVQVVGERELGRNVYSFFWNLPAGAEAVVRYELRGVIRATDYRLTIRAQTLAADPEQVEVRITPTPGWFADPPRGFDRRGRTLVDRQALEGHLDTTVRWRPARE